MKSPTSPLIADATTTMSRVSRSSSCTASASCHRGRGASFGTVGLRPLAAIEARSRERGTEPAVVLGAGARSGLASDAIDEAAAARKRSRAGDGLVGDPYARLSRPEAGPHPNCRSSGRTAQRRSLFASMSNHIAKSVSCSPAMSSTATSTIVGGVISLPAMRRTTSSRPSTKPDQQSSARRTT